MTRFNTDDRVQVGNTSYDTYGQTGTVLSVFGPGDNRAVEVKMDSTSEVLVFNQADVINLTFIQVSDDTGCGGGCSGCACGTTQPPEVPTDISPWPTDEEVEEEIRRELVIDFVKIMITRKNANWTDPGSLITLAEEYVDRIYGQKE